MCKRCGQEKPLDDFNKKGSGYRRSLCRPCESQRRRELKIARGKPVRRIVDDSKCAYPACSNKPGFRAEFDDWYCGGHVLQLKQGRPLADLRPMRSREAVLERDWLGRKCCIECANWKIEAEFERQSQAPDGLKAVCRDCRTETCVVEGCDNTWTVSASSANPYCAKHRARIVRHGDPGIVLPIPVRMGIEHGSWQGDDITYMSAHFRVRRLWGPAKQYNCVSCDRQAKDWAYDGTDPLEKYGPTRTTRTWCFYSPWPEFYMPMCSPCHRRRDKRLAQNELREYRLWRHNTGLSLEDVDELLRVPL